MPKRVLILGGGLLQIPLIKKAKQEGLEVYLSDYYENPPGKKYCDEARQISTFSIDDNYKYALEKEIDYIMTIGTDQPVYTAASVSEKLNLPFPISEEQGRLVTNKYYMKTKMQEGGIPSPDFRVCSRFEDVDLKDLKYPLVMKPVDSQGQRGIYVLEGKEGSEQLKTWFENAKKFSLTGSVIFEEFYPGKEITVNSWVKDGQAFSLVLTDRIHYNDTVALGICKQQRFPCRAAEGKKEEIDNIVQKLVDVFGIKDGPLYIQMIVGDEGVKMVEFGYRIGGGFEADVIPQVTGIDILDLYFRLITEGKNYFKSENIEERAKIGSMFFMFAKPGSAQKIILPSEFQKCFGRLFIKENEKLGQVENATSRVGCFGYYANTSTDYYDFIEKFDAGIAIYNQDNEDLLIHNIWE